MSGQSDWVAASNEQEAKELAAQVNKMGLEKPEAHLPEKQPVISNAEKSLLAKAGRATLIHTSHEVEVIRKNPDSPLYSIKSFQELHLPQPLLEGLANLGFSYPSKIQETSLPTLLADPPINLIAQSQSGTGKTAAFSLGMLSRIDSSKDCVQAICLSPTFELARQTADFLQKLGKFCPDIKIRLAVKGEFLPRGSRITEHIVVGTPGKMVDWVAKSKYLDPSHCKVFVLDEADVMIAQQGHQDQSVRIHKLLPATCQKLLFSATYDETVMMFAEAIISNPVILRLKREEETLENISQIWVDCPTPDDKYEAVSIITSCPQGQCLFFCKTKHTALWLFNKLNESGYAVALLTGDLTAAERLEVITEFRLGQKRVMVCTNVVARGIDIDQITLVVNFDLPETQEGNADCETYLHRIGRTGRFGKTGRAVNLIDGPHSRAILEQIESHFKIEIEKVEHKDIWQRCFRDEQDD